MTVLSLNIRHYLGLVRFSHTFFALPFALASMVWAAQGLPTLRTFMLILICMVTCRNAAMAFNRLVDADLDKANPRTAKRHLPAGILSRKQVLGFFIFNALGFVAATYFINLLALLLALPTLLTVCGYSLTKRFTSYLIFFWAWPLAYLPPGPGLQYGGVWIWNRCFYAWLCSCG